MQLITSHGVVVVSCPVEMPSHRNFPPAFTSRKVFRQSKFRSIQLEKSTSAWALKSEAYQKYVEIPLSFGGKNVWMFVVMSNTQ